MTTAEAMEAATTAEKPTAYRLTSATWKATDVEALKAIDAGAYADIRTEVRALIESGLPNDGTAPHYARIVAAYALRSHYGDASPMPLVSARAAEIGYLAELVVVPGWFDLPADRDDRIEVLARGNLPEKWAEQTSKALATRSRKTSSAPPAEVAQEAPGGATDGPATDALHPDGRCECFGEGRCDWCKRVNKWFDENGHAPDADQGPMDGPVDPIGEPAPRPATAEEIAAATRPVRLEQRAPTQRASDARPTAPAKPQDTKPAVAPPTPPKASTASPFAFSWPYSSRLTPEQLAERPGSIGASEAGIVLGLSKYSSPAALARKKREAARTKASKPMDAGVIFEFAVLREFARLNPEFCLLLNFGTFAGPGRTTSTLDACAIPWDAVPSTLMPEGRAGYIDMDGHERSPTKVGPLIVIDAKNPDDAAYWDEEGEYLPRYYWCQVQLQMHTCVEHGSEVAYGLVVAHSRVQGWRQVRVDYDRAWCLTAVETLTAWYERHVVQGEDVPPSSNLDDDAWGYSAERDDGANLITVEADDEETLRLCDYLRRGSKAKDKAEANVKLLRNLVRQKVGDQKGLMLPDGSKVLCTGTGSKTSTDWKRIAERLAVFVTEETCGHIRKAHTETTQVARSVRLYWSNDDE